MDRSVLESDPFRIIEGMLIAAYGIGASKGFIYCRAEYPLAIEKLEIQLQQCKKYGLLGENILNSDFSFDLKIKKGAGAFVCGEETALIGQLKVKEECPDRVLRSRPQVYGANLL
jgi:NADH-quinone oxidoreductase subunit F